MNHLWQSTVFALAAGLLTLAFRRNRAQVRYWLWFTATVKFLVPFALLMSLGSLTPVRPAKPVVAPAVVLQIAEPFPQAPVFIPASRRGSDWLPIVWACGFAAVIAMRVRGWMRVRAASRASVPADIPFVRISPGQLEPGVVGWWRPTLLLPAGIFERLTPPQLQAVLAHELCHVRRRDNLFAAIHMVVEALFWFHPLVWWIGARLVAERECACDEEVLRSGSAPDDYAEAILSVCKLYLESPLVCVSGVTGADLKKRVEAIMANRPSLRLNFAKKIALAAVAVVALALPVVVGALHAQSPAPKFEVASIKLCSPSEGGRSGGRNGGNSGGPSPDRLDLNCATVATLIQRAYGGQTSVPTSGGPAWIETERYRIDAKAEGPQSQETMNGPMLRALLEDRFRLKIRRESKEVPVYEMTVDKGASKLKPSPEGACEPDDAKMLAASAAGKPRPRPCGIFFGKKKDAPGIVTANAPGMLLEVFAESLSRLMDRPVIDKTGLPGRFELYAEFMPDASTPGLLARDVLAPPEGVAPEPGPSMIVALRQYLGLKLEPAKGSREFLVIDHVERPTEN